MPVPSAITDLSTTLASNSPAGSDNVFPDLDNYLRAHAQFVALLRDGRGLSTEVSLASAATCDIGGAASMFVQITGTTTITSFGTNYLPRILRFAGALTLTHNATTLILPTGANITTAAGDMCLAVPVGTSGWRVLQYQRASEGADFVSFLQSGTGASSRTVQAKLRDVVSVKDFGAVGDGVADDTAAIQAALDSIVQDSGAFDLQFESRGGTVHIPAGRYIVSSALTIRPGTCLIGDGPNISVIVNAGTTNNVLYSTDTQGGSVDPLLIENLAVVQKLGVTHTAGNAIHIDAAPYGISPVIRNVRTQDTYGGVYLDWCYPSTLENVHAMRHTAFGFRARRNCTSTLFQNCYAGAITTGSGFLLAGNYMSLVGCASDNNPSSYGYEFDFDGGATTGVSMIGCGSEGCNGGVYADRVAGLSVVSPRLIIKSGGTHGIQLLGTTSATVVAPVITCLASNANFAIYQASSGGISASATSLIATPSLFSNYTNAFNDTDNVWSFGRQSLYGALWNDRFRLGDATYDTTGISRFHFGGDFPVGSGGVAYGENFRIEATAAYTVAASVNYQPVVNAPALTVARLIAGPIVTSPTITAGTVTRLEGARFSDVSGGTANANLALGAGAIPSGLSYSICNTSTRENLMAGPVRWSSSTGPLDTFGSGSPETVVTAPVGSTYRRTDGGASTSFYVKESGTGNTGWVAK